MCGFCGILGPAERAAPEHLEAMTRALDHRGPDDRGTWLGRFAERGAAHVVGLGHTRLSIIDLSPLGHQPMHADDGSVSIAYNGEIYNFRALREELRALGLVFRSECDTEVLIQAWRAWGVASFERLIGMFAFALWDAPSRRLLLVRDRLGIKPLCYSFADGVLSFGSELHALRRHPRFDARIDRAALGRYLRYGYTSGSETIYAGVRRLLPGSYLVWQEGRIEARPFWRLTEPAVEAPPARFEAAVDGLEALLGDAVERRLVADVPIGAFLSGGIDSTAVAALMQERAGRAVRTFSIGFREPGYDEAPHARAVAAHLKTDHTELYVDRAQAVAVAHELPDLYDEPFADSSAIPTTLLSRLTRQHVTVALSGDGGDELFGGYRRYGKLRRLLALRALPGPLRAALVGLAPWAPGTALGAGLARLRARDACALAEGMHAYFAAEDLAAAVGTEGGLPAPLFRETFEAAPSGTSDLRRALYADARLYMNDDILTKVDRASMSVALEVRVPLIDHRVVRYAFSLPDAFLWHEGRSKAPLRALVHRRVPAALVERPKQGFGIPIHALLARELRAWTARYLDPSRLAEEGLLEPAGAARLVATAQRSDPASVERLWYLLCFERWYARTHRGEPLA